MSKTKPILSALVVCAAAYTAYPYVALYRLESALRGGDSSGLAAMIDWDQVRIGLKEDIAEQIDDEPVQPTATAQMASATLPPFGSSFIKGIASKAVDAEVTPESLAHMARTNYVADDPDPERMASTSLSNARLTWAFFENPTTFTVWLRTRAAHNREAVKVRMDLHEGAWKITRVWLPLELLKQRH